MTAIAIARCVALGKASSLVAAGVAGAAVALLVRVGPDAGSVRAAAADVRVGAVLFAASMLLCVAGLLLERAGIDPNSES
jgi:Na+/H+ antiporter NhaD/arsenite permease-like protein